jgi:hypothetical protein
VLGKSPERIWVYRGSNLDVVGPAISALGHGPRTKSAASRPGADYLEETEQGMKPGGVGPGNR